jgi:alkanesulfonate monooxygenase SsuD/methylene tetrahydromethanopterin reductase-like flavin-dependent oxidoreductase (luciferase family)
MKAGYAMFPQGNIDGEPEAMSDQERMSRELRLANLAGELGFDAFWVTEHHFGDYNLAPAPLTVLAYIAGRFPRMNVGSMVVVLPWNDPLRVIEQTVILDYLADGRFLLGIGKGEAAREFNAFGMDLDEGRRRFETNLDLVIEGLSTGVLRRPGEPDITIRPAPRSDFRDRILMAAGSPHSLDRAADTGLPLLRIILRGWEEVADQVDRHRERFTAATGYAPPPCVLLTYGFCDRDPVRARELGMQYATAYRKSAISHYGLADGEADLRRFAEAQMWGTPDEIVEKCEYAARTIGTDHVAFAFRYAGVPYADGEASMRLFATEVLPRLQRLAVPA